MKHDDMLAILEQFIGTSEEADAAARLAHPGLSEELGRDLKAALEAENRRTTPSLAEIAAYVDGMLEGADRKIFEDALAASPDLRAEMEMLGDHLALFEETPETPVTDRIGEVSFEGLRAHRERRLPLSQQQQRALFQDAALRTEYNRLIKDGLWTAPVELTDPSDSAGSGLPVVPVLRAASSAERLAGRPFPGGQVSTLPGSRPYQVLVQVELNAGVEAATGLRLRGPDGVLGYIALPAPDEERRILTVLDTRKPEDAAAADLILNLLTDVVLTRL